ncbi:MAG: polysaccharide pyruvyl transferase family protein [Fimbriimonadales bacterium]|nr:polysaccharide pyruvyl transferase family protein [Fimbriimonadales bacterium]
MGFLRGLSGLDVYPVVLSGDPAETHRNIGVPAIFRRDFQALRKELETSEALVLAGGGLFQDVTSVFSVRYYAQLVHFARKLGKRVILLAQGVGPLRSLLGRRMAAGAFQAAQAITVRDPQSLAVLRDLKVNKPVQVTADLAWLVEPDRGEGAFSLGEMRTIGISARPWRGRKALAGLFGEFAQILYQNQYVPVLVEMDRNEDTQILDAIAKMHGGRCPDIRNVATPSQMAGRIARMDGMVAMRMHAGLFCALGGKAPLMIAYDPKVSAFSASLGLPSPLSLDGLTPQKLWEAFKRFEAERRKWDGEVQARVGPLRDLAKKNISIMKEAIPALAEGLS